MATSSFSKNESKSFLHISADNRIRVYDTDTSRERGSYVEKNNLAHSYTCSSWKPGKKDTLGYFAAGASDGTIIVWDLTRGVVTKVLGQTNESPIPSAITFSNDGKTILVASTSDNNVVQYDLSSGEQTNSFKAGKRGGISMIALNAKIDVIAVGGSSIKLVDINTGRKRKLESKFPGGVMAMCFTPCGVYLAVAGTGSREVLLFDVRDTGSDGAAETTPLAVIAVMGEPKSLSARTVRHRQQGGHGSGGSCVEVLCLYEDVDACFIRIPLLTSTSSSNSSSSSASSSSASSGSRHAEPMICNFEVGHQVLAACFGTPGSSSSAHSTVDNNNNIGVVTLAVSLKSNPSFHAVQVLTDEGAKGLGDDQVLDRVILTTSLTSTTSTSSSSSSKKKKRDQEEEEDEEEEEEEGSRAITTASKVLGPNDMGGVKRPLLNDDNHDVDNTITNQSSKRSKGGSGEEGQDQQGQVLELTLEQRLETLSASMKDMDDHGMMTNGSSSSSSSSSSIAMSRASGHELEAGAGVHANEGGIHDAHDGTEQRPSSNSLVVLIEQALQSGDDALLEQCLGKQTNTLLILLHILSTLALHPFHTRDYRIDKKTAFDALSHATIHPPIHSINTSSNMHGLNT